eukprot:scaffold20780_cov99-Skeletonema_dohrnii-CCMP3373.AAC.1
MSGSLVDCSVGRKNCQLAYFMRGYNSHMYGAVKLGGELRICHMTCCKATNNHVELKLSVCNLKLCKDVDYDELILVL